MNSAEPMTPLFRDEVLADKPNRLHGHIIMRISAAYRVLVAALVAIMALAVVLVTTGEYARTQSVRGFLVTTDPAMRVFPTRPGLMARFGLAESDRVEAGEVIALVDTDLVSQNGEAVAASLTRSVDERLLLARGSAQMIRSSADAQRTQLQDRVASLGNQIVSLQSQIALQTQIVASNRELYARIEDLVDDGFVSQLEFQRRRQNVLVSAQNLARLEQSIEELSTQRSAARTELLKLTSDAQQQLAQLDGSISGLEAQRAQQEGERSYSIRAPISGRVTAIQTSRGARALPETPILTIIPEGSQLRARLFAPSRAIGMVKRGQETTLLLDAFPYQRFGSIKAEIVEISRTVVDPRTSEIPIPAEEPVYLLEAELSRQSMSTFGEEAPLQPGMMLTANIVLEKQTFLDWILSPLRAVLNRN